MAKGSDEYHYPLGERSIIHGSRELVDKVFGCLMIDDRDGFITGLASKVDDDDLITIARDTVMGRIPSDDEILRDIDGAINDAIADAYEDMEDEDFGEPDVVHTSPPMSQTGSGMW